MSREKQIEEMRKDLIEIFDEEYEKRRLITPDFTAEKMTAKDYRKQEWISVDERLPETSETILYFNGEWVDACYFDGDDFMTLDTYESDIIGGVTHWMPLPEAPKMKGGN